MPVRRLDHVNIRTCHLDRLISFYERILGLEVGPRPDFSFPGAWLYCEGQAIVHLVGVDAEPAAYQREQQLEHFAVSAEDIDSFIALLDREEVPYYRAELPGMPITQINIYDPDGNHLHVDFKNT